MFMKANRLKKICIFIMIGLGSTLLVFFLVKPQKIVVFAYHKIVSEEVKEKYFKNNPYVDTVDNFEKQMKYLSEHNYKTLSMKEYIDWKNKKIEVPLKSVLITIDDGDLGIYYEILPILKKYNIKATYFIIGKLIKKESSPYIPSVKQILGMDLIEKIEVEYPNLEMQSYSYDLHRQDKNQNALVLSASYEDIRKDFEKMDIYNSKTFAYPYGVKTDDVEKVLKEKDYKLAFLLGKSSLSSRKDDDYAIKRVSIDNNTTMKRFKGWLLKEILL